MMSPKEEIIETINKLFVFTDNRNWDGLKKEVFSDRVQFDMSSARGPRTIMSADAICELWDEGFKGIDYVNHLAGNYIVTVQGNKATAFVYATATHYKESALKGKTREFVGTYDIELVNENFNWRITLFRYNLKYMTGNLDLG